MGPVLTPDTLSKSPKIIRSIKDNKNPIIMSYKNYSKFDNYNDMSEDIYIERAAKIQNNEEFKMLLSQILKEEHEFKSDFESQEEIQAEESLYKGGFFSNSDKQKMEKITMLIQKTKNILNLCLQLMRIGLMQLLGYMIILQ